MTTYFSLITRHAKCIITSKFRPIEVLNTCYDSESVFCLITQHTNSIFVGNMLHQATYSTQCTQLASRLSNITTVTTGQKNIDSENAV
jgi:hypothetical protein